MICLTNTAPTLPREGIFVIVGVALLSLIYVILRSIKSKKKPECFVLQESDDEGEVLSAITAAITVILEEEAKTEDKAPPCFRVVAFKRTNNRRIGE